MGGTFRALRYPNYRLFFLGQIVSLVGTWIQNLAMSWLVYRLTGSAVLLGAVSFSSLIPTFILAPVAGVLVDRWDRRRLLITTQTLSAVQALALGVLVLTHAIQVWHILVLSSLLGIVSAFDMPGRQAFMVEIVERREDLGNAIALNSSVFNAARLVGPMIAGLTIRLVGEGMCFVLNGVSFAAVIVALLFIKVERAGHTPASGRIWKELAEGAHYAWSFVPIRALLLLLALVSFTSGAYGVLLPVYAKSIFRGNEMTFTGLYIAVGIGAITAALMLAARKSVVGLGKWVVAAALAYGIGLALFGQTSNFYYSLPFLAAVGFGMMAHMAATNTLVQTILEDRLRGRVMAFYTMSFVGAMPIGSLVAGFTTATLGPQWTLAVAGMLSVLGGLLFLRALPGVRTLVRPIYRQKGIMPAPATGD
jgi:MFS family permease